METIKSDLGKEREKLVGGDTSHASCIMLPKTKCAASGGEEGQQSSSGREKVGMIFSPLSLSSTHTQPGCTPSRPRVGDREREREERLFLSMTDVWKERSHLCGRASISDPSSLVTPPMTWRHHTHTTRELELSQSPLALGNMER